MGVGLSLCTPGLEALLQHGQDISQLVESALAESSNRSASEKAMVLTINRTIGEDSDGAFSSGFMSGERLILQDLEASERLFRLGDRYLERFRKDKPQTCRFRSARRYWQVNAINKSGKKQPCILQVAIVPAERTIDNTMLDFRDNDDAIAHAARFNLHLRRQADIDVPCIKVAAPCVCTVQGSCFPAMIPVGTTCTLTPFPNDCDIDKFMFETSEKYLELVHTFFHYANFSSNGKHTLYDLQGCQNDEGDLILFDPCILRTEKITIGQVVQATLAGDGEPVLRPSSASLFEVLHPRCTELCRSFDPSRQSNRRAKGLCGVPGISCGL